MKIPHALRCAVTVASAVAGLLLAPAGASAFSGLYVFGDSLSDHGNLYALTGGFPPDPPYYQGRFSNGPVAAEHLAMGLGLSGAQFHNMAIAGARTGTYGSADPNIGLATGMLTQLTEFQTAQGAVPLDSAALYMVWGGANDLRDGINLGDPIAAIGTAVANLGSIVTALHSQGARHFLLPNLPDLGLVPEVNQFGPGASAGATFLSESFNGALSSAYGGLASAWTDEHFHFYDVMAAQRALTAGAPGNGLLNVSDACFVDDPVTPTLCADPASFIYWDNIHPSAVTHAALGQGMLAAVPEPQTLLMLSAGLLLLLGAARPRRA